MLELFPGGYEEVDSTDGVELVAYTQTREYMKKVTDFYAHYLLLYEGKEYHQPLTVDAAYDKNDLDY
jgi:hypothetical protein